MLTWCGSVSNLQCSLIIIVDLGVELFNPVRNQRLYSQTYLYREFEPEVHKQLLTGKANSAQFKGPG